MNQRHLLSLLLFFSLSLAGGFVEPEQVGAQQRGDHQDPTAANEDRAPWYYGPTSVNVEQKTISQQKSQLRAQQRMARLAARRWYGFSGTRPTVSAMPFTSRTYGHTWMHPGTVWHTSSRPIIVIRQPHAESAYR